MIIINVIYKTNKYKFLLLIIMSTNALKETFYMIFYFLIAKYFEDYF